MGDKKVKDWEDSPSTVTPITAAELERMENRNRDLRWHCPAAWTSIDEFDDDSIGGSWVRVDASGGTSRAVWTELGDVLSVKNNGGDAGSELHAYMIPLSGFGGSLVTGDAIVACIKMEGPPSLNFLMSGLLFADGTTHGAGTQIVGRAHMQGSSGGDENGMRLFHLALAFTNYGTQGSASTECLSRAGGHFYQRLVKLASNTWRVDVSPDGVSWLSSGTVSQTFTPTHAGVFTSSWGTSTKAATSFEFLRRVSGVS